MGLFSDLQTALVAGAAGSDNPFLATAGGIFGGGGGSGPAIATVGPPPPPPPPPAVAGAPVGSPAFGLPVTVGFALVAVLGTVLAVSVTRRRGG